MFWNASYNTHVALLIDATSNAQLWISCLVQLDKGIASGTILHQKYYPYCCNKLKAPSHFETIERFTMFPQLYEGSNINCTMIYIRT